MADEELVALGGPGYIPVPVLPLATIVMHRVYPLAGHAIPPLSLPSLRLPSCPPVPFTLVTIPQSFLKTMAELGSGRRPIAVTEDTKK